MSGCVHPSIHCHNITFFANHIAAVLFLLKFFLVYLPLPSHIACAKQVQCDPKNNMFTFFR